MKYIHVFDIDDTFADVSHRAHFIEGKDGADKDWDGFFDPALVAKDRPFKRALAAMRRLAAKIESDGIGEHRIYFVTGRPEKLRKVTIRWLRAFVLHLLPMGTKVVLYMRANEDRRPVVTFKREKVLPLHNKFPEAHFDYVDDDSSIVAYYKTLPGKVYRAPTGWKRYLCQGCKE